MAQRSTASGARARSHAVLIVADDLTGAADCGIPCVQRGLETVVVLRPEAGAIDADVLAVDANTRAMEADRAADETARVVRQLGGSTDSLVFKKLDSTLRGHVGAELATVLRVRRDARPESVAILAPAFPALGRTTVGGYQRLHGRPLEETEPWRRDGRSGRAYLPSIVAASGLRCALLPLDYVRGDGSALVTAMRDRAPGCDVLACDAETDDDLAALARASVHLGRDIIWAGSAGFIGSLIDAAGLKQSRAAPVLPAVSGSPLFVIGSRSTVTRRQAAVLAAIEDVVSLDVDPTASSDALRASGFAANLAAALATGKPVLVWQTEDAPAAENAQSRDCAGLASVIASEGEHIGALFATGGETARRLLDALDVNALRLIAEVEPGVPMSVALGRRSLPVITKAGAFGGDATLVKCLRAFGGI